MPMRRSLCRRWVPPRATAVARETAETDPTPHDRQLGYTAERGRVRWQKAFGYAKRSRMEVATARFKQVIGGGLHLQTSTGHHVLNRVLAFGRPQSVCAM
jgi:hypothetical protein